VWMSQLLQGRSENLIKNREYRVPDH
jgi:hypothetical protein